MTGSTVLLTDEGAASKWIHICAKPCSSRPQPPRAPVPRLLLQDTRKSIGKGPGSPSSSTHSPANALSPWPTCILSLGISTLKEEEFGAGDQSPFR